MQAPSKRTQIRRKPDRGSYDAAAIAAVLDAGLVCHVGFVTPDGTPGVIPTCFGRVGDHLYLHGSRGSRMLRCLLGGELCVTVTCLDALIVARSAMHHSMNYRSVVIYGRGEQVEDAAEKLRALEAVVEQILPGRSDETRPPTDTELAQTMVVRVPWAEASLKSRTGPVADDASDLSLPYWAGVVPLRTVAVAPIPDEGVGSAAPPSVARLLAAAEAG